METPWYPQVCFHTRLAIIVPMSSYGLTGWLLVTASVVKWECWWQFSPQPSKKQLSNLEGAASSSKASSTLSVWTFAYSKIICYIFSNRVLFTTFVKWQRSPATAYTFGYLMGYLTNNSEGDNLFLWLGFLFNYLWLLRAAFFTHNRYFHSNPLFHFIFELTIKCFRFSYGLWI